MGRHTTKLGESSRAQTRPPLPYPVRDGRVSPTVQATAERRSRRRKSRLAALSAASVLALGGAAGVGMAMADEPESGGSTEIVFSGNCGTLGLVSASSKPNSSEITVTEGTQVRYTNDLGTKAELHVGNESYGIASGSTQVFVMNQSAEVAMIPECSRLLADYGSAQVNVTAAPAAEEQDDSNGSGTGSTTTGELPSRGSDDDSSSGGTDAGPDSGTEGGTDAGPQDEGADVRGEDGPEDADEETDAEEEEEINSFGPLDGEGSGDTQFAPAGEDEVVAVDPKAVADGASGLLALVAIVCLVGVSAAVMRTILKQRATA